MTKKLMLIIIIILLSGGYIIWKLVPRTFLQNPNFISISEVSYYNSFVTDDVPIDDIKIALANLKATPTANSGSYSRLKYPISIDLKYGNDYTTYNITLGPNDEIYLPSKNRTYKIIEGDDLQAKLVALVNNIELKE